MTQELFFRFGVLFLFCLSLLVRPLRFVPLYVFGAFLAYFLLTSSILGFDLKMRSQLMNIGMGILFIKIVSEVSYESIVKLAGWFFLGVVCLNLLLCAMQYYGVDPLMSNPENMGAMDRVVGFMKIKVHLGIMAAIFAPFIFLINPFLVVLCLPLIFFSQSSVAAGVFALSIGFLSYFKMGKKLFVLSLLVILSTCGVFIFLYDMPGGQFFERFKIWHKTLEFALKTNPLIGCGIGAFSKWAPTTMQGNGEPILWPWVHNEYLQMFFEGGIAALFLIAVYLKKCFRRVYSVLSDPEYRAVFASLLTVFAVSVFHFPFHLARLAIPCLFVMALYELKATERCR